MRCSALSAFAVVRSCCCCLVLPRWRLIWRDVEDNATPNRDRRVKIDGTCAEGRCKRSVERVAWPRLARQGIVSYMHLD